jgi:DNA-binding NtrC family response regulator
MSPPSPAAPPRDDRDDDDNPIAIVDDDPVVRRVMRHWIEGMGLRAVEYNRGHGVLDAAGFPSVVCLDLGLGDVPGLHVLQHLRARDPDVSVIVVTAAREVDTAVEAMRAGAYDYLVKPLDQERFVQTVRRALERRELLSSVRRLRSELDDRRVLGSIVGRSAPMRELARRVERVLDSDVTVCILGESGTGKELVAQALHGSGRRRRGPFVALNCAAIPHALQESELFGHEKGSFTGASGVHRGRFEQAHGGTLFLDELGEMTASTQAALLRTLQERTIRRVGGSAEIPVDVRIIAATHRDLAAEVKAGRFREDLYFRLVVYPIHLPPLRERRDDIPLLVAHFLRRLREDVGREIARISPEALEALGRHAWPGNVRELQNVVHRAMLACDGEQIELAHLPPDIAKLVLPSVPPAPDARAHAAPATHEDEPVLPLRELERRAIERAMRVAGGNVARAARMLGIGRATLYRRLAELGLSPGEE